MSTLRVTTVDFETFKIEDRPNYPPKPTSVSIIEHGKKPVFLSWGQSSENNCTKAHAKKILNKLWRSNVELLFHNMKFDVDVAETHFNVPKLPWHKLHDTMFLAFLHNPHETNLKLKTLADEYLDMPATEQDELQQWILKHVFTTGKSGSGSVKIFNTAQQKAPQNYFKIPPSKTGAFIAYGPGGLVGRYADGDTIRTQKLFKLFYPYIVERGMIEAYNRERKLMRILLENERVGIHTDEKRLRDDSIKYQRDLETVDTWISKKLKAKGLRVDEQDSLADALDNAGYIDEWVMTKPTKAHPQGKRSLAKDNIQQCINDKKLLNVLIYRNKLANSLRNFILPWAEKSASNNGFISTNWNQVRQSGSGNKSKGARTGRLSSNNPSLMNVTNSPIILNSKIDKRIELNDQLIIPAGLFKTVSRLPVLRSYITPDKGQTFINRDFAGQELRVLGHYEDGALRQAYDDDPKLDIHEHARVDINEMLGTMLTRKPIKNLGFGLIYGMGLALLAASMNVDQDMARNIKSAYLSIFPGLKDLIDDLMERGRNDEPIMTWGGREYYVEPPAIVNGQMRSFEYKLLNVLIQGSSADGTKQAIINYDEAKIYGRFVLTVHDEIMVSTEKPTWKSEMKILNDCMLDLAFDVPMLSDGKQGSKNWAEMRGV